RLAYPAGGAGAYRHGQALDRRLRRAYRHDANGWRWTPLGAWPRCAAHGGCIAVDRLALPYWDELRPEERERVGRLGADLPPRFGFTRLRRDAFGDQRHQVAFFEQKGKEFALIPRWPGGPR